MTDHEEARNLICEIGRRMYQREFVAGHEGNLSIRLDEKTILCTPTMHCKGDLAPEDLCVVDLEMNVVAGATKPTSEIRLHLEIYRQRDDVHAVVHSHPPHATAFAVARRPLPCCYLAEPDLFLGETGLAPFEVPGTEEFARSIVPFVKTTNAVLLANHGLVTYGNDLKSAFWMTEIFDASCRTLILSTMIGGPAKLTSEQGRALARKRSAFGFDDPRDLDDPNCDFRKPVLFREAYEEAAIRRSDL